VETTGGEATEAPRSPVRLPQTQRQPQDVNKNLEVQKPLRVSCFAGLAACAWQYGNNHIMWNLMQRSSAHYKSETGADCVTGVGQHRERQREAVL